MQQIRYYLIVWIALQGMLLVPDWVQAACGLSGVSIAFGSYDPTITTPLDTAGSVVYRCSQRDHNIMITLDKGGGTSFAGRRLVNGADLLFYNLYLDAARTIIWGDGTNGSQSFLIGNPQSNNVDLTIPMYGRIPGNQNVKVGAYTDTITVTVSY